MSGALTYPTKQSYFVTSATLNSSGLFLSSFENGILKYSGSNVVQYGNIPNPVVSLSEQYALDNLGNIWNIGTSALVSSGLPTGYNILQSTPNGLYICGPSGIYDVQTSSPLLSSAVTFARFESGIGYFGGPGYYGVFSSSANTYTTYALQACNIPIDGVYGLGIVGVSPVTFGNGAIAAYADSNAVVVAEPGHVYNYAGNQVVTHSVSISSNVAVCPFVVSSGFAVADAGNGQLILQGNIISVPGIEPFIHPSPDYATVLVATSANALAYSSTQQILNINLPGTFVYANGCGPYAIILATSGAVIFSYTGVFSYSFYNIPQTGTSAAISDAGEFLISNNGTLSLFNSNTDLLNEYVISAEVEIFAYQ